QIVVATVNISNETLRQPTPSTEGTAPPLESADAREPEVVVLAKLLASRTRERDEALQKEVQARKAFDSERQELRRELSDLRRQSEEQSELNRENNQLKQQLATMNHRQAEGERMLADFRKERAEAVRSLEEKIAAAEKRPQEQQKQ